LGNRDRKRVVQEALLLARASHQNVVRCFGVVHDPDNPNDPSNIDGSLVMEWVYGGDLYKWLQANDSSSFRERLTLAAQVRLLGLGYVAVGVDTPAHFTAVHHQQLRCTKAHFGARLSSLAGRHAPLVSFCDQHARTDLRRLRLKIGLNCCFIVS
jgi:hypothetical protein